MRFGILAAWILPLWATIDAARHPAADFHTIRTSKVLWLLPAPIAVVGFVAGRWWWVLLLVALALTAWYLAKVRDLLLVAAGVRRSSG